MGRDTRREMSRRERVLRFRATAEQEKEVEARAASGGANHPILVHLRPIGGRRPWPRNGDLGWVAGLLKLWPAEKRGQGASPS